MLSPMLFSMLFLMLLQMLFLMLFQMLFLMLSPMLSSMLFQMLFLMLLLMLSPMLFSMLFLMLFSMLFLMLSIFISTSLISSNCSFVRFLRKLTITCAPKGESIINTIGSFSPDVLYKFFTPCFISSSVFSVLRVRFIHFSRKGIIAASCSLVSVSIFIRVGVTSHAPDELFPESSQTLF